MPALLAGVMFALAGFVLISGRADDRPLRTPTGRVIPAAGDAPSLSPARLDHIVARHWPESRTRRASRFAAPMSPDRLRGYVAEAARAGDLRRNTGGRPGTLIEYDFHRAIGTTIDGDQATRIRVVVDERNAVVTAFPY